MAKGWATNKKQQKRYFDPNTGAMYKGFKKIGSDTYYFYSKSGVMATGWVTNSKKGYKYYFDPSTEVLLQRQAPGLSRISLPMHYFR